MATAGMPTHHGNPFGCFLGQWMACAQTPMANAKGNNYNYSGGIGDYAFIYKLGIRIMA